MVLQLDIKEKGPRVELNAYGENDGKGLYKAYITGETGRVLLGTLVPEGDKIALVRTMTIDTLRRQGGWPIVSWEAVLVHSFEKAPAPQGWDWLEEPQGLFSSPLWKTMWTDGETAVLYRKIGEEHQMAFPYQTDKPFPLTTLFCFAKFCKIMGGDYLLFSLKSRV